ncbi:hypothetical protein V496_00099, partial [Pseudogymnoascus sp. VKM F-4515 (FW-2607)]
MEGNNTIISRREKFRQGDATRGTKRKRPSFEDEIDEVQAQRWKKLQTVDIQQALEEMFSAGTQFCRLQKPALEAIMKHESPILVVMGTGVGKSMLFQIPAKSVSSGTTIVITPLVSLQGHIVERWEMRAQIVIVTPESVVSKTFARPISDPRCSSYMDSTPDFRPQMQQLRGIIHTRGADGVLTATLPNHTEPKFMRIMKIKPEEVQTFRGATTRRNIAYSVHKYADESDETDAICKLVGEKLEQYAAPAKIIVYGGSIERTQELSKALGCHQYYREVGDREEKGAIMERWQRGDGRLIVATNAFGLGIDAPDVRVAGGVAEEDSTGQSADTTVEDPESRDAAVGDQAGGVGEDREVFERQCEVGEERCDVCEKDDAIVEDSEARRVAYVEEQGAIQEQAAQAERERQGRWVDSGIDVPNSSMRILALSSEVLDPRSVIVASQPFTDQNPTPSEEGYSIPRLRCSSVSFNQGFAADHDPVSESHVDVRHTLENCPNESRTKVIAEIEALKTIRFKLYAS